MLKTYHFFAEQKRVGGDLSWHFSLGRNYSGTLDKL